VSSRTKAEAGDGELLDAIVGRWDAIENGTHRVRDVSMGEDACRIATPECRPQHGQLAQPRHRSSTTCAAFKRKPKLHPCLPGGAQCEALKLSAAP
jgi:uncharacterized protein (DUF3084 family)